MCIFRTLSGVCGSSDFLHLVVFLTIEQIFLVVVFQIKNISICTRTKLKPLKKTYRWLNSSFRRKPAHPECFSSMFRAWFESECDQRNLQNPGRRKITLSLVFLQQRNFPEKNAQIPLNVRKIPILVTNT